MEQKIQNLPVKRELTPEVEMPIRENLSHHLHSDMKRMWQENQNLSVQEAIAKVEKFAQSMGI